MVSPACLPPAVLIFLSCDADKVQTPPRATPAVRPGGEGDRRSNPQMRGQALLRPIWNVHLRWTRSPTSLRRGAVDRKSSASPPVHRLSYKPGIAHVCGRSDRTLGASTALFAGSEDSEDSGGPPQHGSISG
jgi:hypothetical protein